MAIPEDSSYMTDFKGKAEKRNIAAMGLVAKGIGCEIATLQAIIQVETAGSGYDKEGRPKALFEPHIFYRLVADDKPTLRRAIEAGVAYKRQGTRPYPRDSYPHIVAAMKLNPAAAWMATSWGLGQILGENFQKCGYASVLAMVLAFMSGEDPQIKAMANFLVASDLTVALREKDWAKIERVYNGPSGWKHGYAKKLAAAYAHAKAHPTIQAAVPNVKPYTPETHNEVVAQRNDSMGGAVSLVSLTAMGGGFVVSSLPSVSFNAGLATLAVSVAVGFGLCAVGRFFSKRAERFRA